MLKILGVLGYHELGGPQGAASTSPSALWGSLSGLDDVDARALAALKVLKHLMTSQLVVETPAPEETLRAPRVT